ncbi:hypothetical protein EDC52_10544 [Biostraticola tofi]|uniref:Uncharacterized protein n=1 Tax=Biostraticola tofi TaxID=466109 RepID=A0A4R3YSQ4_9GAMM|nr:hypothetical protein EDC52_10544 [Biostraticola tofi]
MLNRPSAEFISSGFSRSRGRCGFNRQRKQDLFVKFINPAVIVAVYFSVFSHHILARDIRYGVFGIAIVYSHGDLMIPHQEPAVNLTRASRCHQPLLGLARGKDDLSHFLGTVTGRQSSLYIVNGYRAGAAR